MLDGRCYWGSAWHATDVICSLPMRTKEGFARGIGFFFGVGLSSNVWVSLNMQFCSADFTSSLHVHVTFECG